MTDGNTVATINPVLTETEMSFFTRVANTVVAYSDLATKVPTLEAAVKSLETAFEHERKTAADFAEQLHKAMAERDEAREQAKAAIDSRIRVETDYQQLRQEADRVHAECNRLADQWAETKRERDDYGMQVLTLTNEVDKLKAKLARFHAILADDEPKHEPAADNYAPQKAMAVEIVDHNSAQPEPIPVEAPRPFDPQSGPAPTADLTGTTAPAGSSEAEGGEAGYVPFAPTDPTSAPSAEALPATGSPSEPQEDRVYVFDHTDEVEYAKANRWDSDKHAWYYVKGTEPSF